MGGSSAQIKDGELRKGALSLLVSGELGLYACLACLQHRGQSKQEFIICQPPASAVCFRGYRTLCGQKVPIQTLNTDAHNGAGMFVPKVL